MKKNIFIILSIFLIIFEISSCKKTFLDERNFSSYTPATLGDSLGFEASAIGLYNQFSNFLTTAGPNGAQGWLSVWQLGTDIAYGGSGQTQGIENPYWNYAILNNQDGAAAYTWQWAYQLIGNANSLIVIAEDQSITGITKTNKNKIDGEARFFRAYAYNLLATCFGGVPVITQPLTAPKTNFVRAPLDTVNNLIEKDLLFAAKYLPDIENVNKDSGGKKLYGRANKAMASQLLAEAYLRMNKPALAEAQCDSIITGGKFKLITARFGVNASKAGDPFSDMFVKGNQRRLAGNTESIWVLEQENPATIPGGQTGSPQQRRQWGAAYYQIAGLAICDSLGGRAICRLRLNNWVLYSLYGASDMRNSQFSIRRRYWYNDPTYNGHDAAHPNLYGKPVPYAGTDTMVRICPSITKWGEFDPNGSGVYFNMVKDFILMRLGETYLLKAEAQFKQGNTAGAATSINVLRTRANAAQINATDVTMDFILDERARELVGEENRRMTLMRTGTLVDRALRLNHDAGAPNQITGLTTTNLLLPIPLSEIQLNKDAVLEQNPGY